MRIRSSRSITRSALAICVATGLLGALTGLTQFGLELEESVGLSWLFALRGPLNSPQDVALVAIRDDTAAALGLQGNPDHWPRAIHAELIARLNAAGADSIVFDLFFNVEREDAADDRIFADAVREAGNIILIDKLAPNPEGMEGASAASDMHIEIRNYPIPPLRAGAYATAPFPLARVPNRVSQFWAFGPADPGTLTLPSMGLYRHTRKVHAQFMQLLNQASPGAEEAAVLPKDGYRIRTAFSRDPKLAARMRSQISSWRATADPGALAPQELAKLEALIDMYEAPDSLYLNFYGPARTIQTIPYQSVLASDWNPASADLAGKLVVVGYSDQNPVQALDEFTTVFSNDAGVSLGGAEIAATAFANLLQRDPIKPLPMPLQLLLLLGWGFAATLMLLRLSARIALPAFVLVGTGYFVLVTQTFNATNTWLPLVVPVLVQIPAAVFLFLSWRYLAARAQSARHRKSLGMYLPPDVVEELTRDTDAAAPRTRLLYGTCLTTDITGYTSITEQMRPDEIHGLLNTYYGLLFREVERQHGFVADVVGDSMVAVWSSTEPDPANQARACQAARNILLSVQRYNAQRTAAKLPTRLGIHSGEILLGNIGAESHFEYRAVGAIVNTASRIQALNKQLGTDFLVSAETLCELKDMFSRPLGKFMLQGKQDALSIHDLVTPARDATTEQRELAERFGSALQQLNEGNWSAAEHSFASISKDFPFDGPSRFYQRLARNYLDNCSQPNPDGSIAINSGH